MARSNAAPRTDGITPGAHVLQKARSLASLPLTAVIDPVSLRRAPLARAVSLASLPRAFFFNQLPLVAVLHRALRSGNLDLVRKSLKCMCTLAAESDGTQQVLRGGGISALCDTLRLRGSYPEVVSLCSRVITRLSQREDACAALTAAHGLTLLLECFTANAMHTGCVIALADTIAHLALLPTVSADLVCSGCASVLIEALSVQSTYAHAAEAIARAICFLAAANIPSKTAIASAGGIQQLIMVLKLHVSVPGLVVQVAQALCALAVIPEIQADICASGGVDALAAALEVHKGAALIAAQLCRTLFNVLLNSSPGSQSKFLEASGLHTIIAILELHSSDAAVVEPAFAVLGSIPAMVHNDAELKHIFAAIGRVLEAIVPTHLPAPSSAVHPAIVPACRTLVSVLAALPRARCGPDGCFAVLPGLSAVLGFEPASIDPLVVELASKALSLLAAEDLGLTAFFAAAGRGGSGETGGDLLSVVMAALQRHGGNAAIAQNLCSVLSAIAIASDAGADAVLGVSAVPLIVSMLRIHGQSAAVASRGLKCIDSVTTNRPDAIIAFVDADGVTAAVVALKSCRTSRFVAELVPTILRRAYQIVESVPGTIVSSNGIAALAAALAYHRANATVVKDAAWLLARVSTHCQRAVCPAIPAVVAALILHTANPAVLRPLCWLLHQALRDTANLAAFVRVDGYKALFTIVESHHSDAYIAEAAMAAVASAASGGDLQVHNQGPDVVLRILSAHLDAPAVMEQALKALAVFAALPEPAQNLCRAEQPFTMHDLLKSLLSRQQVSFFERLGTMASEIVQSLALSAQGRVVIIGACIEAVAVLVDYLRSGRKNVITQACEAIDAIFLAAVMTGASAAVIKIIIESDGVSALVAALSATEGNPSALTKNCDLLQRCIASDDAARVSFIAACGSELDRVQAIISTHSVLKITATLPSAPSVEPAGAEPTALAVSPHGRSDATEPP